MKQYTVHLYKELQVTFTRVQAGSPEEAASMARERSFTSAQDIMECEGGIFYAVVHLADEPDSTQSTTVEFEKQRMRKATQDLLAAVHAPELDKAHDHLSNLLESQDAGNDEIRDAAIEICETLNSHYEKRRAAIAKAIGQDETGAGGGRL